MTEYDPDAPKTDEELELETIVGDLACRLRHARDDSAEQKMILRQMAGVRRSSHLAALMLEEVGYWG